MIKFNKKFTIFITFLMLIYGFNIVYADSCTGLLTEDAYELIQEVFGYVMIAVPVILLVLVVTDLFGVVISQDDSAMKKAGSRIIKRFIVAAAIFFVPALIRFVLSIDAVKVGLNLVDDPLCNSIEN